jgi:hypothetical protein
MMLWESVVGGLLGKVAPKVADYYIQKSELKHEREMEKIKGKIAYEKAKTERAIKSEGYDHDWEMASIQNSGWKDEFVLIILSVPMFFVFVPGLEPYISVGFEKLATTPDWYRWLVMMIYGATFGIRVWRRKA